MIQNLTSSIFKHLNASSCFSSRFTRPRLLRRIRPFRAQLIYLLFISFIGYLALISTILRGNLTGTRLGSLDAAFMSISAVTSSSMSTVEMEVFTNTQLIFFTFLMLLGGEVFVSMLGLFLQAAKNLETSSAVSSAIGGSGETLPNSNPSNLAELGFCTSTTSPIPNDSKMDYFDQVDNLNFSKVTVVKALAYLVLAYLFLIHFCGSLFVYIYVIMVPNAARVLKSKMIRPDTFSIFLTASSFANCGFVPANENMAVFRDKSVLLLLVIPQVLMGNTFYPICIRILIRVMEFLTKNKLYTQILSNTTGYKHLLSSQATEWLGWTGLAFVLAQVAMLTGMEWGTDALAGMNPFQKLVAFLFQAVSSRHSGESVLDLSTLSPAILVLVILMMYFPPYFTFMPTEEDELAYKNTEEDLRRSTESADISNNNNKKKKKLIVEDLIFSQLAYLAVFVILVSITERKRLRDDPLNFNVLNIVVEVISAYGNVGFSTGYSCKRQIEPANLCVDKTYGFAGRWSSEGKLILIVVMMFGKLKKFNHKGGEAWKTL